MPSLVTYNGMLCSERLTCITCLNVLQSWDCTLHAVYNAVRSISIIYLLCSAVLSSLNNDETDDLVQFKNIYNKCDAESLDCCRLILYNAFNANKLDQCRYCQHQLVVMKLLTVLNWIVCKTELGFKATWQCHHDPNRNR